MVPITLPHVLLLLEAGSGKREAGSGKLTLWYALSTNTRSRDVVVETTRTSTMRSLESAGAARRTPLGEWPLVAAKGVRPGGHAPDGTLNNQGGLAAIPPARVVSRLPAHASNIGAPALGQGRGALARGKVGAEG